QGTGRQDRYPLLSARPRAARRASWPGDRPALWLLPAHDRTQPLSMASSPQSDGHTKRRAGSTHGQRIQTLRHGFAPPRREAGVALRTLQLLLGHRRIATPPRERPLTRQPVATVPSPGALLGGPDDLPSARAA